jgi:hypothetical protein
LALGTNIEIAEHMSAGSLWRQRRSFNSSLGQRPRFTHSLTTSAESAIHGSDVEPEFDDIPIFDDVIFSFDPQFAGFPGFGL